MTQHKHTPGPTREIALTNSLNGLVAVIDAEDWELVSKNRWYCSNGYANAYYSENGKSRRLIMHRLIMNAPKGMEVDHINGDRLDNRKQNLRLCTKAQNYKNRKRSSHSKQPFKGVRKRKNRWEATISVDGKNIHLGTFLTPEDAAAAYDKAAKVYHKDFAHTNGVEGHGISQKNLLSEATDILKTTGLTPRELVERNKELLEALIDLRDRVKLYGGKNGGKMDLSKQNVVIARAKGGANV